MRRYLFLSSIFLILLSFIIFQNRWDNRYTRLIQADAKGYYAYLPALFIYNDFTYSFVNQMEMKYYPEDGSHAKDFKMEQPNGTVVNKCFPGVSIFYLPFFLLACLFSKIIGLPVDGYSLLFQWSIVVAHLFYYLFSLYLLFDVMRKRYFSTFSICASLLLVTLASNSFYYLTTDFTVAHIFGFFGCSLIVWLCTLYSERGKWYYIGWSVVVLSLLIVTRPTNAMMIIVYPLFLSISEIKNILQPANLLKFNRFKFFIISALVIGIAPIFWKIQSGNWLVYSYGNEKMDLFNPHLIDFLFSYKQGWFFWSPIMFFALIFGFIYFFKENRLQGFLFIASFLGISYVFSSWWIWTYGQAMGQRPMIDFYPILIVGFAGFLNHKKKFLVLLFLPLVILNVVQAHQMKQGILIGGTTTKNHYWKHFLQIKKDPPVVNIHSDWEEVERQGVHVEEKVFSEHPFSTSVKLSMLEPPFIVVVNCVAGGRNEKTQATLALSNEAAELYDVRYIQQDLYKEPRKLSYEFHIEKQLTKPIICYLWNPDETEPVEMKSLELVVYRKTTK